MSYVISVNTHTDQRAAQILHYLAVQHRCIWYSVFARLLGIDTCESDWMKRLLAVLWRFEREDKATGRPRRSALVVSQSTGLPGHGYWSIKKVALSARPIEHQRELEKVFEYPYDLDLDQSLRREIDAHLDYRPRGRVPTGTPRQKRSSTAPSAHPTRYH